MNSKYQLILGSKSPRRKELLEALGLSFKQVNIDVDEIYPDSLEGAEIAEFLACLKARGYSELAENELLICSDTVVWCNNESLAKAKDADEAKAMLEKLSYSKTHEVISAICLKTKDFEIVFSDSCKVEFKELSKEEIEYYINTFQPYDKAGAYGIQEWIGMIGIQKIEGSYFTVMGLPTHLLYQNLKKLNIID